MALKELFDLHGRTALVTGASRGIGRAIALGLAEYGADVAIGCEANRAAADAVVAEAAKFGVRAGVVQASLGKPAGPRQAFDAAIALLGRIDILVLNASIQIPVDWLSITPEQFEEQINVNLRSTLELMQLCIPLMQQRSWGRVLAIGSVQEDLPHPRMLVYAGTKSAQESMVRNLAKQVGGGVTINNLAPGVIATDRNARALGDPARLPQIIAKIPTGRIGEPVDCAGAALLLCSNAGAYINGATLFVDGGMRL